MSDVVIITPVTTDDGPWVLDLFHANRHIWPSGGGLEWYRYSLRLSESEHWDKAVSQASDRLGFIHWRVRRDGWRSVYELLVDSRVRMGGIGRLLIQHVGPPIKLKTTVGGGAEAFYERLGFVATSVTLSRNRRFIFRNYEWRVDTPLPGF